MQSHTPRRWHLVTHSNTAPRWLVLGACLVVGGQALLAGQLSDVALVAAIGGSAWGLIGPETTYWQRW